MSSKQTQINKFVDGINTDLHPLTAPDNLLSDCVNGTVITYNGNEYILQNDMGNIKLKNAQLPINHIPIGVKEFGGIIYIVSYNPVDGVTEVGSYPSPKTIFETEPKQTKDADEGFITLENEITNYTEIVKQGTLKLYSSEEEFKLCPGDKYYIHFDRNNKYAYQTLDFYVLSDEKDLYKIDNHLITHHATDETDSDNFDIVAWDAPGWLAYKFRVLEFDSFNVFLSNINVPAFIKDGEEVRLDYQLRCQLTSSDVLADNDDLVRQLAVWVTAGTIDSSGKRQYKKAESQLTDVLDLVQVTSEEIETDPIGVPSDEEFILNRNGINVRGNLLLIQKVSYNPINKILYTKKARSLSKTLEALHVNASSTSTQFFIEAIPMIYNAESGKHILYDNYAVTYTIDLGNIGKYEDLEALTIYKYIVDDDDLTLQFNITSSSAIPSLKAAINIYNPSKPENEAEIELGEIIYKKTITDLNVLGQNIINIPWAGNFIKENTYILEFVVSWGEDNKQQKTWYRTLVASEVMNAFFDTRDDFSEISFDEIIQEASSYVEWNKVQLGDKQSDSQSLYTNMSDKLQFTLNEKEMQKLPVLFSTSTSFTDQDNPAGGIQSNEVYNISCFTPTLFGNENMWKDCLQLTDIQLSTENGDVIKVQDNKAEFVFKSYRTIPISPTKKELIHQERIYLYDYTCLCNSNERSKKHSLTYDTEGWIELRYWTYPETNRKNWEKIFRAHQRVFRFSFDEDTKDVLQIDDWNKYKKEAARTIKYAIDQSKNIVESGSNRVNSATAAQQDDWRISTQYNESLQLVNVRIPWRDYAKKILPDIGSSTSFIEGPFFINFDKEGKKSERGDRYRGPMFYIGFDWLHLGGEGEVIWDAVGNNNPENVEIWEKNEITDYKPPFSYYSGDTSGFTVWDTRIDSGWGPSLYPSPDPLLIATDGKGIGGWASDDFANCSYIKPLSVTFGDFLPMYSGVASYSEGKFPSISNTSPAPTWIKSLWGIRIPVFRVNTNTWYWAILPIKDRADDNVAKLWIDNSGGSLTADDIDLIPSSQGKVPRADLSGERLDRYNEAKSEGFTDLTKVPGWNNDGQSCTYLQNILNRATTLATHLYTTTEEAAVNNYIVPRTGSIQTVEQIKTIVTETLQKAKINVHSLKIWNRLVADTDPIIIKKDDVPLPNDLVTKIGKNITSETHSKEVTVKQGANIPVEATPTKWNIPEVGNAEGGALSIVLNQVDRLKYILDNKITVTEQNANEARKPGQVYHDLRECGYQEASELMIYFDNLVEANVIKYKASLNRFYIENNENVAGNMGMTYGIVGRSIPLWGKYGEYNGSEGSKYILPSYQTADAQSPKTVAYLAPKIGLPPYQTELLLSSNFCNTNDNK